MGGVEKHLPQKISIHTGGDLYEQWSSLEQTGSTAEYIRRFIELAASLEEVSDWVAAANFIKGLKPNIKNELRMWAPDNLGRAMDLAQQIEEKNRAIRGSGFGALGNRSGNQYFMKSGTTTPTSVTNPSSQTKFGAPPRKNIGDERRLTEAQIHEKRSRGLCYKCDEKWHPVIAVKLKSTSS